MMGRWLHVALDVYEAAAHTAVAAQRELARDLPLAPARTAVALCADLVRDVTVVQVSAVRWALDS